MQIFKFLHLVVLHINSSRYGVGSLHSYEKCSEFYSGSWSISTLVNATAAREVWPKRHECEKLDMIEVGKERDMIKFYSLFMYILHKYMSLHKWQFHSHFWQWIEMLTVWNEKGEMCILSMLAPCSEKLLNNWN